MNDLETVKRLVEKVDALEQRVAALEAGALPAGSEPVAEDETEAPHRRHKK